MSATCERVLILDRGRLVGQESAAGLEDLGGWTSPRVVLSWDGDRQGVAEALGLVAGVDDVIVTEDGAEVLIAGNPIDVRPQLVETVLAAGGRLQNIKDLEAKGPSLEDLFLMLTGSGPAKDTPGSSPHRHRTGGPALRQLLAITRRETGGFSTASWPPW